MSGIFEKKGLNMINDRELEKVNGGVTVKNNTSSQNSLGEKDAYCPRCQDTRTFLLYSGGRAICRKCGEQILL